MTDEELMERVVGGDLEALGTLFERYKQPLFSFVARLLRDDAWAEDVMLDAFLRVHERRRTYKPGYRFSTWLYTIAHHLATDRLRRHSRCEQPALHDALLALPDAVSPQELCERHETAEVVRLAVRRLPDDQRAVIVLREYEGFSYREIAAITGASEAAVRVRAHRARLALRDMLAPLLDENAAVTFSSAQSYKK